MNDKQQVGTRNTSVAPRRGRPSWKDPRLFLGLVLIGASAAGTVFVVSQMNSTVPMYAAKADITLGEELGPEKFNVVQAHLGDSQDHYLPADPELIRGTRANDLLPAGQLISRGSLTRTDDVNRRPINIEQPASLSSAINSGSYVDVWVAAKDKTGNSFQTPELLVSAVEVAQRSELDGGLVNQVGVNLELLVPENKLQPVLSALANEARITVVYNPLSSRK